MLSLCLMMVGTCPIQKFLSSAFSVKVEASKQPSLPASLVKHDVRCAEYKEMVNAPLVEQSTQGNSSNALFILLGGALPNCFKEAGRNALAVPREDPIGRAIPLFLRNQVFRI